VLFAMSLPASWSYVSFMKVEKRYLNIRMDVLYSIYLVFAVASSAASLLGSLIARGAAQVRRRPARQGSGL
jgi:hypothetical protein